MPSMFGRVSTLRRLVLSLLTINALTCAALPAAAAELEAPEKRLFGQIKTSFFAAAAKAAVPPAVIDKYVDPFAGRVDFRRDLQPGDSFVIVLGGPRPELTAASLFIGGKLLAAIKAAGSTDYFDERGEPLGRSFLRYPIRFTRISSLFSSDRLHPLLMRSRPHLGVDFAEPIGTPVRAVADGVVTFTGFERDGGLNIHLKHGSRYSSCYLHLSKFAPRIRTGARVTRGQIIGAVGKTGLATGPHLHFGLFDRGRYVNPLTALIQPVAVSRRPPPQLRNTLASLLAQHQVLQFAARLMPEAA